MTAPEATIATARLISIAIFLNALEWRRILPAFSEDGVWSWSLIRRDFAKTPAPLRWLAEQILNYPAVRTSLSLLLWAAALNFLYPNLLTLITLFVFCVLIYWRFRGSYNGGADYMTTTVLTSLLLAAAIPGFRAGGLYYLAIQATLSYTIGGIVKLREPGWRDGSSLQKFILHSEYDIPSRVKILAQNPRLTLLASRCLLFFECSFPVALISPGVCRIYLAAGLVFHLLNFYVFGLNRFFWAWLASYPAIYYLSLH